MVGKQDNALQLTNTMMQKFNAIKQKAETYNTQQNKSVYFEISPLNYGLWTSGKGTFMHEIAVMLNVKNAFEDLDSWCEVSQEQVIAHNPYSIVSVPTNKEDENFVKSEILNRRGWSGIDAIKNSKLIVLDDSCISRPGPRLVDAAEKLYKFYYEE